MSVGVQVVPFSVSERAVADEANAPPTATHCATAGQAMASRDELGAPGTDKVSTV